MGTCDVPGTVLGCEDIEMNKVPALISLTQRAALGKQEIGT